MGSCIHNCHFLSTGWRSCLFLRVLVLVDIVDNWQSLLDIGGHCSSIVIAETLVTIFSTGDLHLDGSLSSGDCTETIIWLNTFTGHLHFNGHNWHYRHSALLNLALLALAISSDTQHNGRGTTGTTNITPNVWSWHFLAQALAQPWHCTRNFQHEHEGTLWFAHSASAHHQQQNEHQHGHFWLNNLQLSERQTPLLPPPSPPPASSPPLPPPPWAYTI